MDPTFDDETEEEERYGLRMDVLANIIDDINNNEELQTIFGTPVAKSLVVIADSNDIRIEEGGVIELTDEQEKKFIEILDSIIKSNAL